jgi:hypothetical protein
MYRRVAVLGSLAVVLAMCVGSSTANAQGTAAGCVFTGLAGHFADSRNGASGIPAILDEWESRPSLAPLLDWEWGAYAYAGDATCAGTIDDQEIAAAPNNASIVSSGRYDSRACLVSGWLLDDGHALETALTAQTATGSVTADEIGYEIELTAGSGALEIGPRVESADPPHDGPVYSEYSGDGAVRFHPEGGNCVTSDLNRFSLDGAFEIHD